MHPLPDTEVIICRQSTLSTTQYSTTSSSSPELTLNSALTPISDNERVMRKNEETDDPTSKNSIDAKPDFVPCQVPLSRRQGRPRKHQVKEGGKPLYDRSKTGCTTCRRRKKKCDETKPTCSNCEKINVACDGYEPKQPWRSGKRRVLSLASLTSPITLPMLLSGVGGETDQKFFQYFTGQLGKVLPLVDHHNPYLEIIVPMAMSHTGLMHSILYLSASCLIAKDPQTNWEWVQRQEHHCSRALRLLQEDLAEKVDEDVEAIGPIGDASIAQTLILTLQTVCAGDVTGSFRYHLDAMKEMLTQRTRSFPNEHLRQFILEFLLYYDYSSSITSLLNPLDARSFSLMDNLKLPGFMIQSQAGTFLGVLDGLFGFISRIRALRDQIRARQAQGQTHWWNTPIMNNAFAIDNALRRCDSVHNPSSPRYITSLLFRQCTWIYLQRTIQPSRASRMFKQAVDEGLQCLRLLPWNANSTQSILLMPLFLLGCAAFDQEQRTEIRTALVRLQAWSCMGNIKYAREIVEQVWQMMDEGRESETWDWETIIARRGWDFLVT